MVSMVLWLTVLSVDSLRYADAGLLCVRKVYRLCLVFQSFGQVNCAHLLDCATQRGLFVRQARRKMVPRALCCTKLEKRWLTAGEREWLINGLEFAFSIEDFELGLRVRRRSA